MRKPHSIAVMGISVLILSAFAVAAEADAQAEALLEKVGIAKGICVVLGDPTGDLAIETARASDLLVYVQLPTADEAEAVSRAADTTGLYGSRVFVGQGNLSHVHLADNVADALIAVGEGAEVSRDEALRVLRPEGRALLGADELVKPPLAGADDWSHPFHGPDNNPQSKDTIIRAPYLTQFLADPRYAPVPQVAVASSGRVFKAFGHVAFKEREEALLNTLAGFNGYNGTLLWKRDLADGVMIHRNTMVATPDVLYVGDDASCRVIDSRTGELLDEIAPPADIAGGTFWKWMALDDGVLYAVLGDQEQKDAVVKMRRDKHGWPWNPVSKGFNQPENPWGFGRNLLAIDPKTKDVLWSHRESQPADCRAVCKNSGHIFLFRFGEFLTCVDAATGEVQWRKTPENGPELFAAIGEYSHRQGYQTNWRTTAYLKCSDDALYFAGPQITKLLAVSTKDGSVLWEYPYDNFQLVLRGDGLYGVSGHWGHNVSRRFDPLTGEVLEELDIGRRACTRPTGAPDAIFFRAQGGTTRFDLGSSRRQWVSPMRPNCHDGVTIANGLLYWWPSTCDCQLSLYGVTCLGPAGDFEFSPEAVQTERLVQVAGGAEPTPLPESPADWPTFRANNHGTCRSHATIPATAKRLWQTPPRTSCVPTAPVAVGGLAFVSGSDGIVRALEARTGKVRWKAHVGGAVRISPTVWEGRVLVGSGDGRVYALEAQTGRRLWAFRAAPMERRIPVYGSLMSTWPVAGGVRVENGTAYLAAGIVNYDGTHVYALDAATGEMKWQNSTSGHLDKEARTGVSVQGPMLVHGDTLYMPGGSSVSPAMYALADGTCLNDPDPLKLCESSAPRGCELFLVGDKVVAAGQPYYGHADYPVVDPTAIEKTLVISTAERDVAWVNSSKLMCFNPIDKAVLNKSVRERKHAVYMIPTWGGLAVEEPPTWGYECTGSVAVAASDNAVVIATQSEVTALNMEDGALLWAHPVPTSPVPWGLAVDCDGRAIVCLRNGQVVCFG